MPWFDKEKDEEYKKAKAILAAIPENMKSKTPEELSASLKEAEDLKTKLSLVQNENQTFKTALEAQKSEFDRVKAHIATLEAAGRAVKTSTEGEPIDFIMNPQGLIDQRVAPLAQMTAINASQTARILAQQQLDNEDFASDGKSMNGRLFRAWAGEIDGQARLYQASQLVTPQAWLGIFYYVKGQHADELANPESRKTKYSFLESSRSSVPTQTQETKNENKLTEAELNVATKMGIKPEDYLKRKKAMSFATA